MAFFWFLAFVVALIVLISKSNKAEDRRREAYWRGRSDERLVLGVSPEQQVLEPIADQPTMAAPVQPQSQYANQPEFVQPVQMAVQPETPESKERRTVKNLNIMLYVGSFLIVAATALFVTLTMPAIIRLAGIIIVTLGFYISGLVLHRTSQRLRSAAVAFVGTGLAIVPFIGFALTSLGGVSGEASWMITSILGIAAYAFAAMRLQSEFVSYATIAFVISLSLSVVPTLQLSVVWYFISIVSLSTLVNLISLLRPSLLPDVFTNALRNSSLLLTPITLCLSLGFVSVMDLWMYWLLFALSTLQYLFIALITGRSIYDLVVRVLAQITLMIVAVDISANFALESRLTMITAVWSGLCLIQVVYSLLLVRTQDQTSRVQEQWWIGLGLGLALLSTPVWLILDNSLLLATQLLATALFCGLSALKFSRVNWAYGSLASMVLLLFVICRLVIEPALPFEIIALAFTMAGAVSLVCLERMVDGGRSAGRRRLMLVSLVTFAAVTAFSGLLEASSQAIGWTMLVAAALMIAGSLVVGVISMEVVGALAAVVSIAAWTDKLIAVDQWKLTVAVMASTAAVGIGTLIHQKYAQTDRRNALAVLAAIPPLALIYNLQGGQLVVQVSALVLLILGAGMLVLRAALRGRHMTLRIVSLCGYVVYPVLALMLSAAAGIEWLVLVLLGVTVISWISSYVESTPPVKVAGHFTLMAMLFLLWSWLDLPGGWGIFVVTWLSAGIYYLWYWYSFGRADRHRQLIALWATLVALVMPAIYGLLSGESVWVISSAMSILAIAAVLATHGYLEKKPAYYEASIYIATLGLQRIVATLLPGISLVVYAHWWAAILILVDWWRGAGRIRLGLGLGFVTLTTGLFALFSGDVVYMIVFLIEHIIIALVGALVGRQWMMWWGVVAVLLAVMYFIRSYTFLVLLLLGFLLILFVVWRLLRSGRSGTTDDKS